MIYLGNREFEGKLVGKFNVEGVDVYPDHEADSQWWYVPGTIKLAERKGKKVLSYLWYTEGVADADGTGFFNVEVNTAVDDSEKNAIRRAIASKTGLSSSDINLSTPTYHTGSVTFTVLGPIAAQAPTNIRSNDPSVLYQSTEQLVWTGASPSLVGDNAAVCSVKFKKDGKLAAAMREAIVNRTDSVSAVYRLEFLAMRPSVEFKVEGSLKETIMNFEIGLGAEIPLEAVILEGVLQAKWEQAMKDTKLKSLVKTFTGEPEQGEKWAKKLLLEYILANYFKVAPLSGGVTDWDKAEPLSKDSKVSAAVEDALDTDDAAEEKKADLKVKPKEEPKEKPKEEPKDPKEPKEEPKDPKDPKEAPKNPKEEPKDPKEAPKDPKDPKEEPKEPKEEPKKPKGDTSETTTSAADSVVALAKAAKAALPIPKVKLKASFYYGTSEAKLNFEYLEMKAKSYPALPQALVFEGLAEGLAASTSDPDYENKARAYVEKNYVTSVNRSLNPFGLPYNVGVSLPDDATCKKIGVKSINVTGTYPVGAPANQQRTCVLTVVDGKPSGPAPFDFQRDEAGSMEVQYSIDYVFNPGDWEGDKFQYSTTGKTDKGLITARPETVVELLTLEIGLSEGGFVWDRANQAVVTLTSKKWSGEKRVVLQKGKVEQITLKIRTDIQFKSEPVQCKVELKRNNELVHSYTDVVEDNRVAVRDKFKDHIPVYFTSKFEDDVEMTLTYKDDGFKWEDQFTIEPEAKKQIRIIPAMKAIDPPSDLKAECEVEPSDGDSFTIDLKGGKTYTLKPQ